MATIRSGGRGRYSEPPGATPRRAVAPRLAILAGLTFWLAAATPADAVRNGVDRTFGANGVATYAEHGLSTAWQIAQQPGIGYLARGYTDDPSGTAIVRFNEDGQRDMQFAGDGVLFVSSDELGFGATAMAIGPENTIYVGGEYCDDDCGVYVAKFSAQGMLQTGFGNGGFVRFSESNVNTSEYDEYINGPWRGIISNFGLNDLAVAPNGTAIAVGSVSFQDTCDPFEEPPPACDPLPGSNQLGYETWGMKFEASAAGRSGVHFGHPDQSSSRYPFDVERVDVEIAPSGAKWINQYASAPTEEDQIGWFDLSDEAGHGENVASTDALGTDLEVRSDGSLIAGGVTGRFSDADDQDGFFVRYGSNKQIDHDWGDNGYAVIEGGDGTFDLENDKIVALGGSLDDTGFSIMTRRLAGGGLDTSYGTGGDLSLIDTDLGSWLGADVLVGASNRAVALDDGLGEWRLVRFRADDFVAPNTDITSGPPPVIRTKRRTAKATFAFNSPDDPTARFQCNLDDGGWAACTSPKVVTVGRGAHVMRVRAVDEADNADESPSERAWRVRKKR